MEETITITKEEHARLLYMEDWITCLEAAGVEHWEGIDEANRLMDQIDEELDRWRNNGSVEWEEIE